jgi:voltage-dependent potassium channel beta subunit
MEYRRLGESGLKVSAISLGGWTTFGGSIQDATQARRIIEIALEGGVNFFDQADAYARGESEKVMGAVLKDHPRERVMISSKLYWPMSDDVNDRGLGRKHIRHSIEGSLKRLGTDYLDIYFCHRHDADTPVGEVVHSMSTLIERGQILYWGTSEWSGAQIQEAVSFAQANGLHAPVTEQPQYSLIYRERVEKEILPVTQKNGVGLVVWSPLGMGVLTGKFDAGDVPGSRMTDTQIGRDLYTPQNIQNVRQLKPIADELGVTRGTLALAWALRSKAVASTIVGATKPEQMTQNLEAADFRLSDDALAKVEAVFAAKK